MVIFLGRIKGNDRDVCQYIDIKGFECGHYFSGLHVCGACFSGFESELRELITNDFDNFETILTQEEVLKLFEINDQLKALGYGIEKDSEKYKQGLALLNEFKPITDKLSDSEGEEFFNKVQESEKEYCMKEYDLDKEAIDLIFDEYMSDYKDRAIISYVFADREELEEEEKWSFGYENTPYFNTRAFVSDLLDSEDYLELDNGKIVRFNY